MQEELLCSFSVISNGEKMTQLDGSPPDMRCLNGMRVLSISWVVLGHVYVFGPGFWGMCWADELSPITTDETHTHMQAHE